MTTKEEVRLKRYGAEAGRHVLWFNGLPGHTNCPVDEDILREHNLTLWVPSHPRWVKGLWHYFLILQYKLRQACGGTSPELLAVGGFSSGTLYALAWQITAAKASQCLLFSGVCTDLNQWKESRGLTPWDRICYWSAQRALTRWISWIIAVLFWAVFRMLSDEKLTELFKEDFSESDQAVLRIPELRTKVLGNAREQLLWSVNSYVTAFRVGGGLTQQEAALARGNIQFYHGEKDLIASPEVTRGFAQELGAEFIEIPGRGHLLAYDGTLERILRSLNPAMDKPHVA